METLVVVSGEYHGIKAFADTARRNGNFYVILALGCGIHDGKTTIIVYIGQSAHGHLRIAALDPDARDVIPRNEEG